jgi:hypothetical protein
MNVEVRAILPEVMIEIETVITVLIHLQEEEQEEVIVGVADGHVLDLIPEIVVTMSRDVLLIRQDPVPSHHLIHLDLPLLPRIKLSNLHLLHRLLLMVRTHISRSIRN